MQFQLKISHNPSPVTFFFFIPKGVVFVKHSDFAPDGNKVNKHSESIAKAKHVPYRSQQILTRHYSYKKR